MFSRKIQSVLAPLVALIFATGFLAPCMCSTASAAETADAESVDEEGCCPDSEEKQQDERRQQDQDEDSCCCSGGSVCGLSSTSATHDLETGIVASFDEDVGSEGPTFWLTPDLLAISWLADRLVRTEEFSSSPVLSRTEFVRSDRSDIYLYHSILLI